MSYLKNAIVILNFNGRNHLETFLPSVIKHSDGCEIFVADNASTDDSIHYLKQNHAKVFILALSQNYGFAEGYNQALAQIKAENYILLNSDVEVTPNWTLPLLASLDQEKTGAVQAKILSYTQKNLFEYAGAAGGFLDKFGYPYCRGRIFDTCEKDNGQYDNDIAIFWATGACFAIKAEVFHKLGGFDARFFAHMEEIDLCWRLQNEGYINRYVGNSTVYHLGGGTLNKNNPRKTYLNFRNGLLMLVKNLPSSSLIPILGARLVLDGLSGLKFLLGGKWQDTLAILKAHFAFYSLMPIYLFKRKSQPITAKRSKFSVVFQYFIKKQTTYQSLPNHD